MQITTINNTIVNNEKNLNLTKSKGSTEVSGYFGVAYSKSQQTSNDLPIYENLDRLDNKKKEDKNVVDENSKEDLLTFINKAMDTLKNCVTEEDYSRMAELGLAADKDDLGVIVTVYERIQIQLTAYLKDYDTTGLNISPQKLEKVLGTKSLSNAVDMASEIDNISDDAKEYIIKNELEPTIENVYKAVHTSEIGSKSSTRKQMPIEENQWKELRVQVDKFLNDNGIEVEEETVNKSKWLLDKNIPLTIENLLKLSELDKVENMNENVMNSIKANVAFAVAIGEDGKAAYITQGWINKEVAEDAVETIQNVGENTISYITSKSLTLNIANLKKYKEVQETYIDVNDKAAQKNMKIVEEAKLLLTIAGAVNMQKLGIDITYSDLSNITQEIKAQNENFYSYFVGEEESEYIGTLSNVAAIMEQMTQIPAAVMGKVYTNEISFTVDSVYKEGISLKELYTKAEMTYEAVGTQVRRDLGDSINKAFSNIDELLSECDVELNEENRRAVRILGYNSLEITKESISDVVDIANELDNVNKNLTPKTVMYLIRNNIDPLNTDIRDLNQELHNINEEIGVKEQSEEYAKFLWKLEKNGEITEDERKEYISMYRTMHIASNASARSIGAVMATGADMTLSNMITMEKTRSKRGMDIEIDENFGLTVEEEVEYEDNVSLKVMENARTWLGREISESTMYMLLDSGASTNIQNILSATLLGNENSDIVKMFRQVQKKVNAQERMLEGFTSKEDADNVATEVSEDIIREIKNDIEINQEITLSDIARARIMKNSLQLMHSSVNNSCYSIPVELGEEEVMIKVRFENKGEDEKSNVFISTQSEVFGKISAKIEYSEDKLKGIVLCQSKELARIIKENKESLKGVEVEVTTRADINESLFREEENMETREDSVKELYGAAKSFIVALKEWIKMPIDTVVE